MASSIKDLSNIYVLVCFVKESNMCYKIVNVNDTDNFYPKDVSYIQVDNEIFEYKALKTSFNEEYLKKELARLENKSDVVEKEFTRTISGDLGFSTFKSFFEIDKNVAGTSSSLKIKKEDNKKVSVLGPNGTKVFENILSKIKWNDYQTATYELLNAVFGEETLISHTLTRRRPKKPQLDPKKVEDIISIVSAKSKVMNFLVYETISKRCNSLHMHYKKHVVQYPIVYKQ